MSLGQQASAVTFVNNFFLEDEGSRDVEFTSWVGSSFTTGSGAYSLESADVSFRQSGTITNNNLFLSLYSNNSGTPGTLITTFTNPTLPLPETFTNLTFTLATPQSLTASTTYWLVSGILSGTTGAYQWTYTNDDSEIGLPGWSIGSTYATSTNQGNSWTTAASSLRFSLEGTEQSQSIPEPSSLVALLGLGGLGLVSSLKKRK